MPKNKIKKSVKRKESMNSLVQSATDNKDENFNPSIDNPCLNESIKTSDRNCTVSSSNMNKDNSSGTVENALLTESSSDRKLDNDLMEDVRFPSVSTPGKKLKKRNNETFGNIERVHTHFDDIIVASESVAEHDTILKLVLDEVRDEFDEDKHTAAPTEVPDQSLTITEWVKLWAVKHTVKQDATSSLLQILRKFRPECF